MSLLAALKVTFRGSFLFVNDQRLRIVQSEHQRPEYGKVE